MKQIGIVISQTGDSDDFERHGVDRSACYAQTETDRKLT
jgi:hypothetical protein